MPNKEIVKNNFPIRLSASIFDDSGAESLNCGSDAYVATKASLPPMYDICSKLRTQMKSHHSAPFVWNKLQLFTTTSETTITLNHNQ